MTVDDLKQRMTYEEFLGWMAFLKVREEETRS